MKYFVIPDLHGRHDLLTGLLDQEKIPDARHMRFSKGVHVVQLGDLANCVRESLHDDMQSLQLASERVDTVLVGNHEAPYFGCPEFVGFSFFPEIRLALDRLGDHLQICLLVGETLLTHAGVTDEWGFATAEEAAAEIEARWSASETDELFSRIGRTRGGFHPFGGILWSDFFQEPRASFRQVHGHTPIPGGPGVKNGAADDFWGSGRSSWQGAINLDVGCGKFSTRLVGLWLNEDGSFRLVEHGTAP